jgi:hypothetical protein
MWIESKKAESKKASEDMVLLSLKGKVSTSHRSGPACPVDSVVLGDHS